MTDDDKALAREQIAALNRQAEAYHRLADVIEVHGGLLERMISSNLQIADARRARAKAMQETIEELKKQTR